MMEMPWVVGNYIKQKYPYEGKIHKIDVNSPAEQLGDRASDILKKGKEKVKRGMDWLREKVK